MKKKHFIYGFLLLLFGWILISAFSIYLYSKEYYDSKSDVAIVLGAGAHEGKLSPVFKERVNHSIKLLEDKKVDYIIFTGGFGEKQKVSDSKSAMLYANRRGVPLDKMLIEDQSTITYENLMHAKDIMNDRQFQSALIVSDPLHMKRAMRICHQVGIEGKPSPTQTSMYRSVQTKASSLVYEVFYYNLNLLFRR